MTYPPSITTHIQLHSWKHQKPRKSHPRPSCQAQLHTPGETFIAHLLNKSHQPRLVGADTKVYITDVAICNLNSRYLSIVPSISLYPYRHDCRQFGFYVLIASPNLSGRGNLNPNPLPSRERDSPKRRTKILTFTSIIVVSWCYKANIELVIKCVR